MIVDTLRVENGRFTTAPATQEQSGAIHVTATPTDDDVKSNLLGVKHPGIYSVVDLRVPAGSSLGWGIIEGLQGTIDLFWDLFASLYASHLYMTEAKGKIAIPVLTGLPFTVTGVDPATGLDAFEKVYVPLPVGDPGAGFIVESPLADLQGPYPIFATPFRIELLDLEVEKVTIESVRNFRVRLDGGLVKVTDGATPLAPDVSVALLNVSRGVLDATRGNGLVVPGSPGDRIVLLVEERNASPDTPLSVVFNEPIDLGGATTEAEVDAFLRTRFTLHTIVGSGPPEDVTPLVRFRADSGGRRVLVERDGSLHRGASYRLHLSKEIADRSGPGGAAGLRIAEVRVGAEIEGGLQGDLVLELTSRAPGGELAGFDIGSGAVRDLARSGNLMFVAALDGGVLAWDVADPASLGAGSQPVGLVPGTIDAWWSVAADRHQRVFAAGLGNVFGVLRTFRLEQFLPAPGSAAPAIVQQPVGSGMVSWVPGYSSSLPLASAVVLSDRAEAIPRKLQVLSQDVEGEGLILEEFKTGSGESVTKIADLSGGFEELTVSIAHDPALAYLVQRVTVENLDRGMRWSADARPGAPAVLENVVARANDRLRVVRNQRTWAAVSLFGFGVGIFDLNAMESNDAASKPDGYESIREQVLMTRATLEESACSHPGPESGAIPDLAFTPEAAILPDPASPFLRVYALDATRGILDLKITPAALGGSSSLPFCARNPMGLLFRSKGEAPPDDPRLHAMRAKFEQIAGRPPFGRFNGIATHRWVVEAADNRPLVAGGAMGRRGTVAFERAERDYLLVAGNEYGLLVVEAPRTGFLGSHHLADVVWIPAGAAAVRAIPGADLAAVVDGEGHLLLVDLARIDERWSAGGQLIDSGALFPTLDAALSDAGPEGTGLADPRIVWRSGGPVGSGTLAPLVDPGTGLIFAGRLLGRAMKIVAALDPRLRVVVDLAGDGLLREVGGIIPLGVSQQGGPPAAAPAGSRASASKSLFPAASPNRSAASCASPSRASAFPAFRREGSGRLPQLRPPPPPSPPRLELTRFGGHLRMMVRSPRWHDTRRISAADGAAGEKRAVPGGVEPQLFPYVYLSSQADSVERN
ncbi:MAG TPA: hypothetical protein VMS56_09180 [Thermoanaerobaculia bacterium]|nr:hypothetical protein [Thermoanaerobaculia bacterium]